MFNNPLRKYQSGGQVPSQEQQKMLMAFVEWLPKRVKEFANMAPEQIVEALNGMSKTPEGQKQVETLMQQFQQEMQNTSTSQFKNGGKLHDFICKHAKGGHVAGCGCKEDGGKVEKNQDGKRINSKTRTITNVDDNLSEWEAEELGIDPNTLAHTGVTITAYPNKKPYVADGMLPFFNRNGIAFQSGGIEASSVEDGSRLGDPAVPGRKYKVSTIGGQDYYANPDAMRYPVIVRYASPKDTIYNLGFQTYGSNSPAYSGIRDMYNSAIQHSNTFAWDKDSYAELQRQKNEKKKEGGKVEQKSFGGWLKNLYGKYIGFKGPDTRPDSSNRRFYHWTDSAGEHYRENADVNGYNTDFNVDIPQPGDTAVYKNITTGDSRYRKVINSAETELIKARIRDGFPEMQSGGIIKGQNSIPSGMPEPSTGEIRPDSTTNPIRRWMDRTIDNNSALRTASRYARNFGNSAMGKVLEFFMPNPENALASAPGFKFKMPYIPKYIREMYPNDRVGQIQSAYNHSIAKPIKMTDNFAVEYNRLTGHNGPLLDVLIEKNGGVVKGQNGISGGMPYRYPVSRITDRPVWDEPHVNNPQVYQLPYSSDLRVTWPDVRSAGDKPLSLEHFEYIPGMTRIITEKPGQRDTTLISNGGRDYYSPYMKLYPDFNMSLTNIPSKKAWKKANAKIDAARDADLLNE